VTSPSFGFDIDAVAIDKTDADRIYVMGNFKGIFTSGTNVILTNNSNFSDPYLIKSSSAGNIDWAKRMIAHAPNSTLSPANITAVNQRIFMTATIIGSYNVWNQGGQSHFVTNNGSLPNMCVVKFRSDGSVNWSNVFTSKSRNHIRALNLDGSKFYIFGTFWGLTEFNTDPNASTQVDALGVKDYFIGKYTDSPVLNPFSRALETRDNKYDPADLIVYPSNNKEYKVNYRSVGDVGELSFRIYNTMGQEITSGEMLPYSGGHGATVDLSAASNGVYFVELYNINHKVTKRFLVK